MIILSDCAYHLRVQWPNTDKNTVDKNIYHFLIKYCYLLGFLKGRPSYLRRQALIREHPAQFKKRNLFIFVGHFCSPGSGSTHSSVSAFHRPQTLTGRHPNAIRPLLFPPAMPPLISSFLSPPSWPLQCGSWLFPIPTFPNFWWPFFLSSCAMPHGQGTTNRPFLSIPPKSSSLFDFEFCTFL